MASQHEFQSETIVHSIVRSPTAEKRPVSEDLTAHEATEPRANQTVLSSFRPDATGATSATGATYKHKPTRQPSKSSKGAGLGVATPQSRKGAYEVVFSPKLSVEERMDILVDDPSLRGFCTRHMHSRTKTFGLDLNQVQDSMYVLFDQPDLRAFTRAYLQSRHGLIDSEKKYPANPQPVRFPAAKGQADDVAFERMSNLEFWGYLDEYRRRKVKALQAADQGEEGQGGLWLKPKSLKEVNENCFVLLESPEL